jgi:hypothetical protein
MHVAKVVRRQRLASGELREYRSYLLRRSYRAGGAVKHDTLANLSHLPVELIEVISRSLRGEAFVPASAAVTITRSLPHGAAAAVWAQAKALGFPALLGPACRERDLALARMALFDMSSSWVEGSHCPLAARGYSRDGKRGKLQIEYGLLTDPEGRPVAVRVFAGDTADPAAFVEAVKIVHDRFRLEQLVMVGDRGMITSARIDALQADDSNHLGWITALRAPAIAKLAAEDGPLQMSLFDQHDLAEITHPDYPNERLIACRNPALAAERARKRADLLQATEHAIAPLIARVQAGRLRGADKIALKAGALINKYKMAKHFNITATDTTLTITRRVEQITAEAALDGIYVIRTSAPREHLDPAAVVTAHKQLSTVERDFRSLKTIDLDLRPVHHRLEDRVRAHVLLCMLAAYLTWHLRRAWAPLIYTDEHPTTTRANPVAPTHRSSAAARKASRHRDHHDRPLRDFRGLLNHLATLTRNDLQYGPTGPTVPTLAEPTPDQRRAFDLINTTIPLTIR